MGVKALTPERVTEPLTPDADGIRVVFSTSRPYRAGTVSLWVNGRRKIQTWDDGFVELGGTDIQLNEAPWLGDSLQARYEPGEE
jgi:hypothetical protein